MLPAVHFYDPVIGLDGHIVILAPAAGPQNVPLVFMGLIFDWEDYLPPNFVGVRVNGVPRARAGTAGLGNHVPTLGKFLTKPADKAQVFLGSSTVWAEGKPMAHGTLPVLSCHDFGKAAPDGAPHQRKQTSLMLPSSIVIPIPYPCQVFVGGMPVPSGTALAKLAQKPAVLRVCKMLRKAQAGRRAARILHRVEKHKTLLEKASDFGASD